jgi:hypothetical protein
MPTIDKQLLRGQRVGQGCRPRRCSLDKAKRRYYAMSRTARLAKLGSQPETRR